MRNLSDTGRMGALSAPRRNNYFYGKLMDVPHFQMEQTYLIHQRWLLNRLSLGQGVLCGLGVAAQGAQICVTPGVAIDALGREIVVPVNTCLDPWQLTDDCGQASGPLTRNQAHQVYLCLAYGECTTDYMPVLVTDCNTREACSPGTIVETFCLLVREGEPDALPDPNPQACLALSKGATAADIRQLLCTALSGPCPAPTGELCVPIATIELKEDGTIGLIDTCTYRPRVYSNAALLDLILCLSMRIEQCCAGTGPCKEFPPAYKVAFDSVTSTAGPDSSGDFVVVGYMSPGSWNEFLNLISLPSFVNQRYCDPVQLGPELRAVAYVPSASERQGDFSQFGKPLVDPKTGNPLPNNQIPPPELPSATMQGVFAWRIRSIVP